MTVKTEDITALIEMFSTSGWDELHVEIDGLQLFLSTDPNAQLANAASPAPVRVREAPTAQSPAPATPAPGKPAAPDGSPIPANWVAVKAPNLGTFYRAPKPGAAPFVELGQSIDADAEICLLEVMKLFTAVKAGVSGVVRRVCVEDAELVEGDQILFYIEQA